RAIDTALPHLQPGKSLSFAFLPDGQDPDDVMKRDGLAGLTAVLAKATPFDSMMFEREWQAQDWSTPERRAYLEGQIFGLVAKIGDDSVRIQYQRAMRSKFYEAWGPQRRPQRENGGAKGRTGGRTGSGGFTQARGNRPTTAGEASTERTSALARSSLVQAKKPVASAREALLLKTLLNHLWLMESQIEAIARVNFATPGFAELRDALLSAQAQDIPLDTNELRSHLTQQGYGPTLDLTDHATAHGCDRFLEPDAEPNDVLRGWAHALRLHERQTGLKPALMDAGKAFTEQSDEAHLAEIQHLHMELNEPDVVDGG
ncbi:MAG: DNA primase, partial [Pseudomonadota bacterium]